MAKSLISGAEFHDWEVTPKFIGKLGTPVIREKDGTGENQKAGSLMGYTFSTASGEDVIIGASHAIEKAVAMVQPGDVLSIEFLGKGETSSMQPFNRFKIDQLEEGDEGYF